MKKSTFLFLKLISLLNDGYYHNGTMLGGALNITRSAVWKNIKKLENYGIVVHSVKGKGYTLLEPLLLLDQRKIQDNIFFKNIDINIFESVASTNDYLKSLLKNKIKICLAEQQTEGKGRLQRHWYSPFAQNIYFSCSYPFQKDVGELAGLSLVVSLSIVKTLQNYKLAHPLLVKWPNDILYENKKLSGNLIEIQAESNGICYAIIGIGINVNMLNDKKHSISQPWTSLRQIMNNYVDRNELAIYLINNLMIYLKRFEQHGLVSFLDEWKSVDYLLNKEIHLKNNNKKIAGVSLGIDSRGQLIIKLKDRRVLTYSSGDTSIIPHF